MKILILLGLILCAIPTHAAEYGEIITLVCEVNYANSMGINSKVKSEPLHLMVINPLFEGKTFFVGNIEHKSRVKVMNSLFTLPTSWRDSKLHGVHVKFAKKFGAGAGMQVLSGDVTNDGRILLDDGTLTAFEDSI